MLVHQRVLWDNPSHWLIFFKMVKTTNQSWFAKKRWTIRVPFFSTHQTSSNFPWLSSCFPFQPLRLKQSSSREQVSSAWDVLVVRPCSHFCQPFWQQPWQTVWGKRSWSSCWTVKAPWISRGLDLLMRKFYFPIGQANEIIFEVIGRLQGCCSWGVFMSLPFF